ncbi:MAG: hypothetical protein ACPF9D_13765, partial [Owenweeksia sp.]
MKRAGSLLTLTYLLAGGISYAQMPGVKVYKESDGYPATTGYIINQDSAGFIWIGSNKGAIRYDGHSFRVFDERDGLHDKEVIEAVPGLRNTVLITPLVNNLSYYQRGKIFNKVTDPNLGQIHNNGHNIVLSDNATGNCWVGDRHNTGGVYLFRGNKPEWVNIPLAGEFSIVAAHNNELLVKEGGIFKLFSKVKGTVKPITIKGKPDYLISGSILAFTHDHKYVVGYSVYEQKIGVYRIVNSSQLEFLTAVPAGRPPKQMIIDRKNRLWFTYRDKGALFWGAIPVLTSRTQPIPILSETIVNDVFSDRNDNLWFTTKRSGLYFIPASQWANHLRLKKIGIPDHIPLIVRG